MAALATTTISVASGLVDLAGGLAAAAAAGDTAEVGPGKFLAVLNGDVDALVVTISTTGTVSGLAVADGSYTIAAADQAIIPLANVFRGSTGRATITYDDETSVTVGVFELGS